MLKASAWLSGIRLRLRLLAVVPVVIITYIVALVAIDEFFFASNRIAIKTAPVEGGGSTENGRLESAEAMQLDFGRVSNKTLGFEKVIAIGLPERTDKRDALELMASLTGFDIEWVDGVKPSSIPNKAVPYGIDPAAVRDNFLGSWRGHMNAIRQ